MPIAASFFGLESHGGRIRTRSDRPARSERKEQKIRHRFGRFRRLALGGDVERLTRLFTGFGPKPR